MSKSKRAAQEQMNPAPLQRGNIRIAEDGGLRTGWLLAVSLVGYALAALATRYGLVRAFAALFAAWGVDGSNIQRAPAWARAVYVWHGSLATLAFTALSLLLASGLRRLWRLKGTLLDAPSGGLWRATLAGLLATLIVAALCLLPDSMRLEWPLNRPKFTLTLPVLAILSLLSVLGEEAFTKRVLYDGLRARWNGLWAAAVACGVAWLTGGGPGAGVIGGINALLLGATACGLYIRFGLWTAVGFRWGWSLGNVFLLGFGGGDAAVYRLYGVSEALLTGGDAGAMHGLWATLLLAGLIIVLWLKRK